MNNGPHSSEFYSKETLNTSSLQKLNICREKMIIAKVSFIDLYSLSGCIYLLPMKFSTQIIN